MILVTGGTGFIGQHLVRKLVDEGQEVRVLKRAKTKNPFTDFYSSKINFVDGDVLDIASLEDAMNGIEKVYHNAGVVSFNPKEKDWIMKVNVEGTTNVVNVALTNGIKKFLHVSSIAAIGRDLLSKEVNEKTEWKKSKLNSTYAISKFRGEREVWRGIAEGLNAVIVNPAVVIGAGNWNEGTCRFFRDSYKGLPAYTNGVTGFVDVSDVVEVMIKLMESEIADERFILVSENKSFKDFFFSVCGKLKKPKPKMEAKPWMTGIAWRLFAVKSALFGGEPLVTKETALTSMQQFFYSNEKIKQAINYHFIPLEKTISETCKQFLKDVEDKKFSIK